MLRRVVRRVRQVCGEYPPYPQAHLRALACVRRPGAGPITDHMAMAPAICGLDSSILHGGMMGYAAREIVNWQSQDLMAPHARCRQARALGSWASLNQ